MSDAVKWVDEKAAAAEAVVFALLEDTFKELKEEARLWLSNRFKETDSHGVFAYSQDGTLIGSVTRSKPSEKTDVTQWSDFMAYLIEHRQDLLHIDYQTKIGFLRSLKVVDGEYVDTTTGEIVPGIGKRVTRGTVRVTKDRAARDTVRALLANGSVGLDGITHPALPPVVDVAHLDSLPVNRWVEPEPKDRYTQDREAAGL